MEQKQYEKIPRFNDHGSTCSGHGNYILDCEYETKEKRDALLKVLNNYIDDSHTGIIASENTTL